MTILHGPFWAHSPEPAKGVPPQQLPDHLRAVAELAEAYGRDFAIPSVAVILEALGLLHDLGKYKLEFQRQRLGYDPVSGLEGIPGGRAVDHSSLGATVLYVPAEPPLNPTLRLRNTLAHVIAAHHGGLVNLSEVQDRLDYALRDAARVEALAYARADLPELPALMAQLSSVSLDISEKSRDVLTRMLLSCLVDADRSDTEAHGNADKHVVRVRGTLSLEDLDGRLDRTRPRLNPAVETSELNRMRHEMYEKAVQAAGLEPGFFRLTMPTGGGKTLTSLSFALKHAVKYGLRRIIYAIPYTSIIDQTAQVFRQHLNEPGEENVLEHHSAVEPATEDKNETNLWQALLSESWDAPVIVTTTVQLFESLFANKTGRIRKLHNIAGSVIVLDEVQALPTSLLGPIMDVLSELVLRYHVSVVFCTATQPAFNKAAGFDFPGLEEAREIGPNAEVYYTNLQRVEYDIDVSRPTAWSKVADRMMEREAGLTIVNLRRHALELFGVLRERDEDAFHLSTNMYPAHRKEVISLIRERLRDGQPCRVVSTQLIECGVDVDFPSVNRAAGPLDAIVQAAGRCNREGLLRDSSGDLVKGQVWVFKPEEAVTPNGDYLVKVFVADELLGGQVDLHQSSIFEQYFQGVFEKSDAANLEIQTARVRQDFATVAQLFKFIDSDTVPVTITVRHKNGHRAILDTPIRLLARLESSDYDLPAGLWRELQMYSVNVFRNKLPALSPYLRRILVAGKEELELYEWMGSYDDRVGLVQEGDAGRYMA